jgi:hypothetical protein
MDEKDKFDGTEKIEEEEEKVYIARHAKKDEEDRFADIENFDVDNTETVENKEVEKNSNDVPNNEPAIDSTENFDVHSDNYGDDFDCQSIASKNHIPSDNPKKSNRDYGDGFDAQTGEDRHEFKRRQPNNDDYYENNADTDDYLGKPKKQKKAKKQKQKNSKAAMVCVVVAVAVIVVCVLAFVLSKCSFDNKKSTVTTAPTTKATVATTQEPTTEPEYVEETTKQPYTEEYTEPETTEQPSTEEYTEPETEPYTEEYTEPETYESTPDTEPVTEYVPDETTQIV